MNLRTLVAAAVLLVVVAVNAYLLYVEETDYYAQIVVDEQGAVVMKNEDPLIGLVYAKQNRKENYAAYGMDEGLVRATLARTRKIEDLYRTKIKALMKDAGSVDDVADALCGETTQVRPRYGALRYLVREEAGQRRAIELRRISRLEWQDWSKTAPIQGVYVEVELIDERQPDATLMAIGALMLFKDQDVLERNEPWGSGLVSQWSWAKVKKQNPEVVDLVVDYFATMHLVVELAQAEDGICE